MATINEVILIYLEDKPLAFARVESILPDPKKGWFQIKLLMLQIPLQTVTWILKDAYINGEEFQMNEKRMRLETIHPPEEPSVFSKQSDTVLHKTATPEKEPEQSNKKTDNIISFDTLKKHHDKAPD